MGYMVIHPFAVKVEAEFHLQNPFGAASMFSIMVDALMIMRDAFINDCDFANEGCAPSIRANEVVRFRVQ
jgi:hypothetical protein